MHEGRRVIRFKDVIIVIEPIEAENGHHFTWDCGWMPIRKQKQSSMEPIYFSKIYNYYLVALLFIICPTYAAFREIMYDKITLNSP